MEYTEVIIRKMPKDDPRGLKAIVSVVIDDNEFTVHNIHLFKGHTRWFVAMPSEQLDNPGLNGRDKYRDVAHPIGVINRAKLELAVFRQFEEAMLIKTWLYEDDSYQQNLEEIGEELRRLRAA